MKPRTFLILLALILLVGGLFNYYAFQSLQRTTDGETEAGSGAGRQRPAVLAAVAQEKMRERGWLGGGTGAGNGVSRFQGGDHADGGGGVSARAVSRRRARL